MEMHKYVIIVFEYLFLQHSEFSDIILNSLRVKLICYVSDVFLIYVYVRFTATSEEYPPSNTMNPLNIHTVTLWTH
jgi:hypothetical protein